MEVIQLPQRSNPSSEDPGSNPPICNFYNDVSFTANWKNNKEKETGKRTKKTFLNHAKLCRILLFKNIFVSQTTALFTTQTIETYLHEWKSFVSILLIMFIFSFQDVCEWCIKFCWNNLNNGQEPWSCGYGRRLNFPRLQVRIPTTYTGWTFFTYLFVLKFVLFDLKAWK